MNLGIQGAGPDLNAWATGCSSPLLVVTGAQESALHVSRAWPILLLCGVWELLMCINAMTM
jgi:hypothetical protein